jgi:TusA-related sulfurtransferase
LPDVALTVDGTGKTCKGVIAKLETGLQGLPPGCLVRAIVGDVPTRIDVLAWADRKGHRVLEDRSGRARYELLISKGTRGNVTEGPL